jgi:hypothetical protein
LLPVAVSFHSSPKVKGNRKKKKLLGAKERVEATLSVDKVMPLYFTFHFQHVLTAGLLPSAQTHLLCKQSTIRLTQARPSRLSTNSLPPTFTQYRSKS